MKGLHIRRRWAAAAISAISLGTATELARAVPGDAAAARVACRAALARGDDARAPCEQAFVTGATPEDMRLLVGAVVGGKRAPSMEELTRASFLADGAVRRAPNLPWGYAARCDLARRLGDREMLSACLADLRRVAPDHAETKAFAAVAEQGAPMLVWLGRVLLLAGLLGTLAHAAARRWRRRSRPGAMSVARGALALSILASTALVGARTASAQRLEPPEPPKPPPGDLATKFKVDDEHPEASVPPIARQNESPIEFGYLLQDLIDRADKADKRGEHALAAHYYLALAKAVPDRSISLRKACDSFEAAGDHENAVLACRDALFREGVVVGDYARFVRLSLAKTAPLADDERRELGVAIDRLAQEPNIGTIPDQLRCEIAVKDHDVGVLEKCTSALAALAPNDPATVSLQWALAYEKHDRDQALRLIERARQTGLAKEGLAKMEAATRTLQQGWITRLVVTLLGAALAAGILIFAARRAAASRRKLAA